MAYKSALLTQQKQKIYEFLKTGEKSSIELGRHLGVTQTRIVAIMTHIDNDFLVYEDSRDGHVYYGLLTRDKPSR